MRSIEIKEKIDSNNKIIQQLMSPNTFTLNNTVAELLKENATLQTQCDHIYEDGYCIWCYKEEPHD